MKLFVEGSSVLAERSGIGQFTKRLVEAYHKEFPETQIRLFGFKFLSRPFVPPIPVDSTFGYRLIRWLPGRVYTGLFKRGFKIPMDVLIGATHKDVVLFPNFVRWPLLFNKRSISVIHDLSFILYGQYSSGPNRDYMLKYVPQTIKNSDHLITISENSKRDIIKHFNVSEEKISIVNPFIDTNEFKKVEARALTKTKKRLSLPDDYILFVSSIEPRKNVIGVLEAYEQLPERLRKKHPLVIAGGKGWLNEPIHEKADQLVSQGYNIIRTGYVSDGDLPAIYSGAKLFVFPSFYEGFGIPPLEAMACGVPVITSNNSSLTEVVDDAAITIDATDTKQLVSAIKKVLTNTELSRTLTKKGYIRSKFYNPARSAKQLNKVLELINE